MDFLEEGLNLEYVHHQPNVVKTARRIFEKFMVDREVICCAEMQSGKSEVMKRVVEIVMEENKFLKKNKIAIDKNNVYVILCASSVDLKTQLCGKVERIKHHVYHINDIVRFMKNVDIYQDLFLEMSDNSLVMFDECHCDAEQKKTIDKFRKIQKQISKKNNTVFYRLGFSATPYEQITIGYSKVIMKPGDDYYGIRQMFEREIPILYPAKKLTEYDQCVELFNEIDILPMYYIFRLPKKIISMEEMMSNIMIFLKEKKISFNSLIYDMKSSKNINQIVKKEPTKMTIIFIKDKLRMGEYLDTTNVYLAHDSYENSFAHTTVQSLLGRCCGYGKYNHNVLIYCDYEKAEYHYDWVTNKYSVEYMPPAKYLGSNGLKSNCYF